MDKKYAESETLVFFKLILLIILAVPYLILVGYLGIHNPKIDCFLLCFLYGQLIVIITKFLFEEDKRKFIRDVKKGNIESCFKFDYELKSWTLFINNFIHKRIKKNSIVSIFGLIISIALIFFGYDLKNDGEFSLAVGYNLLLLSLLWLLNSYVFEIRPLIIAKNSSKREIQCFKYGIMLTEDFYIVRKFNYIINVSLDNKYNICIKDESRGTSLDGHSTTNIIRIFCIPIPQKSKNDSDNIYKNAFRGLITKK